MTHADCQCKGFSCILAGYAHFQQLSRTGYCNFAALVLILVCFGRTSYDPHKVLLHMLSTDMQMGEIHAGRHLARQSHAM